MTAMTRAELVHRLSALADAARSLAGEPKSAKLSAFADPAVSALADHAASLARMVGVEAPVRETRARAGRKGALATNRKRWGRSPPSSANADGALSTNADRGHSHNPLSGGFVAGGAAQGVLGDSPASANADASADPQVDADRIMELFAPSGHSPKEPEPIDRVEAVQMARDALTEAGRPRPLRPNRDG